ncbi:MAG: DUF4982 domain-containing protein [Bacteroidales bacterium]|nr:DUF4982 domain-containing protein [Bacteroidales bacterium]
MSKFTKEWRFQLIDSTLNEIDIEKEDYDDNEWRVLDLPHDWAIEGDFSESNPSGTGGGALPGGLGWYRKTFDVTSEDLEKQVFITFDGIYMNSTIYINGEKIGHRPYGYATAQYNLTPHLHKGENTIAVRVDNTEQPNSRWYSGCGIYRNVWLTKTNDIHIDNWGTYVTTPLVNSVKAHVNAEITIVSNRAFNTDIKIISNIIDAKGKCVATTKNTINIENQSKRTITQSIDLNKPHLWNIDDPYRYKLVSKIYENGTLIDEYTTVFGVRNFYFDADQGFILNNKNIKINGVCMHHDLGCLGAAINKRAIERQLEILKKMGCNGIRCSHNPPAPELLDLCDSMGFIVMDEAFDMWRKKKTAHDYARYFNEWHEKDLTDLIMRDRNHPSIFMWSIGNEVLEQWTDANADTLDIAAANLLLNMKRDDSTLANGEEASVNSLLCMKLCDMVHKLDPTRPVTAGNNEPNPNNHLFKAGTLDIIGFNYHDAWFEDVPKNFPHKPFIVTESVSGLMTRGYYRMPSGRNFVWPERWDKPFYDQSFACSSYDNCHVPWGNSHENTLKIVKKNKFISGQYIWTGFDYIGEPTPYGWPARSSYFGVIDLAGFPKDIYYMYQSEWTNDKPVLHLFPHWNWKDGEDVDIWCYYNQADEVELYLNGESMGIQRKDTTTLHALWNLEFKRGELRAVSRKGGKVIKEQVIRSAGRPAQIRMTPDRERIRANGEDLSFITVEVLDKNGNLCPTAENDIHFEIEGTGFIAGVDNGSPISMERFKDNHRKAFYGKCLVVVQSNGDIGNIRIVANADGLSSAEAAIHCLGEKQY